jgi:hypothetical protein
MLYGNIRVYGPDAGEPMFRIHEERARWYVGKGLAVFEAPDVLRLTFKPRGPGHAGSDYFLQDFKNICVVCGISENLSHHHIVPDCYRRHFPRTRETRGGWMHDVLLLCIDCHSQYEPRAHELKVEIAKEHEINPSGVTNLDLIRIRAIRAVAAIARHGGRIPEDRRRILDGEVSLLLGRPAEDWEYRLLWKEWATGVKHTPAGEIIVGKLKDLEAFAVRWRKHFLKVMKPKYLPNGWDPERRIYDPVGR